MKRLLLVLALASACSGSAPDAEPTGTAPPAAVAGATTTWVDGTLLRGTVEVPAGSTVELAPGAVVRGAKGARLVVKGALVATSGEIRGTTVVAARGGRLSLRGVDLPGSPLVTEKGALPSTVGDADLRDVDQPVQVAEGTTLTLDDVRVREASGPSIVTGTLVASRLSYDKGGNNGMVVTGVLRMSDSELFGDGRFDGDMITTSDAKEVTVSDTEVRDVHCAFHLVGVGRLILDGLDIHDNAYGFMAYGSDPTATHRITDTDVYDNRDYGLQETPGTTQGRIVIDGGYWGDNGDSDLASLTVLTGKVERVNPETRP